MVDGSSNGGINRMLIMYAVIVTVDVNDNDHFPLFFSLPHMIVV